MLCCHLETGHKELLALTVRLGRHPTCLNTAVQRPEAAQGASLGMDLVRGLLAVLCWWSAGRSTDLTARCAPGPHHLPLAKHQGRPAPLCCLQDRPRDRDRDRDRSERRRDKDDGDRRRDDRDRDRDRRRRSRSRSRSRDRRRRSRCVGWLRAGGRRTAAAALWPMQQPPARGACPGRQRRRPLPRCLLPPAASHPLPPSPLLIPVSHPRPACRSRSRDRRRSRSPDYDPEGQRRRPTWFDIPPIGGAPPPLTQLPGAVQVFSAPGGGGGGGGGGAFGGGGGMAATSAGAAMSQQATRHARRIYVGGLPPSANEQNIQTFFSNALAAVGGTTAGPGMCVVNVYINYEKKFAFVEMRTGGWVGWGGLCGGGGLWGWWCVCVHVWE